MVEHGFGSQSTDARFLRCAYVPMQTNCRRCSNRMEEKLRSREEGRKSHEAHFHY